MPKRHWERFSIWHVIVFLTNSNRWFLFWHRFVEMDHVLALCTSIILLLFFFFLKTLFFFFKENLTFVLLFVCFGWRFRYLADQVTYRQVLPPTLYNNIEDLTFVTQNEPLVRVKSSFTIDKLTIPVDTLGKVVGHHDDTLIIEWKVTTATRYSLLQSHTTHSLLFDFVFLNYWLVLCYIWIWLWFYLFVCLFCLFVVDDDDD
jgi:hypothetical protein